MDGKLTWQQQSLDDRWQGLNTIDGPTGGGQCPAGSHQLVARLLLYRGDVCRLPRSIESVCVHSGLAWISHAGHDLIIGSGETARFAPGRDFAVVSALGESPLILAVYAGSPCGPTHQQPQTQGRLNADYG